MASTSGITLKNNSLKPSTKEPVPLSSMLASEDVKKRFNELLGKNHPALSPVYCQWPTITNC